MNVCESPSNVFCWYFTVWAETGDFRDNNSHGMNTVSSMDHTSQLGFPTAAARSRTRDRKGNQILSNYLRIFKCLIRNPHVISEELKEIQN